MLSVRSLIIILIVLLIIGLLGYFEIGPFNTEDEAQTIMNILK